MNIALLTFLNTLTKTWYLLTSFSKLAQKQTQPIKTFTPQSSSQPTISGSPTS